MYKITSWGDNSEYLWGAFLRDLTLLISEGKAGHMINYPPSWSNGNAYKWTAIFFAFGSVLGQVKTKAEEQEVKLSQEP